VEKFVCEIRVSFMAHEDIEKVVELTLLRNQSGDSLYKLESIGTESCVQFSIVEILERVEATMVLPSEQVGKEAELVINKTASVLSLRGRFEAADVAHEHIRLLMCMCADLDAFKSHTKTNNSTESGAPFCATARRAQDLLKLLQNAFHNLGP